MAGGCKESKECTAASCSGCVRVLRVRTEFAVMISAKAHQRRRVTSSRARGKAPTTSILVRFIRAASDLRILGGSAQTPIKA